MRASATAAQALQGDLDGTWALSDGAGRRLAMLEFTDPAGGAGPVDATWQDAGPNGAMGPVGGLARRAGSLTFTFGPDRATARFTRRDARTWVGWIARRGHNRPAMLRKVS